MVNVLNVYWEKELVGQLWLGGPRELNFQYEKSWLNSKKKLPISLQLPLQETLSDPEATTIFFSNLLPEADIRKALSEKYGVSPGNNFKLLVAVGGECAGALSLLPKGEVPAIENDYEELEQQELVKMIDDLPKRPLIIAKEGARLSLAGAQNKLPLLFEENKFFLPKGFTSSTHILKPPISRYEYSCENEAFCMQLANEVGLMVPKASVYSLGKYQVYLVERYDREINDGEVVRRIHQEDFCQALGFYAEQKYENEGGPGFEFCFKLIQAQSYLPLADKIRLVRWAIFNFLVGNSDAHAKNLSLLFMGGKIRLAPFYDIMSTCVYPDLNKKMAMKIGGHYDRDRVFGKHWKRFANEAGVPEKLVTDECMKMAKTLQRVTPEFAEKFKNEWGARETISHVEDIVRKYTHHMISTASSK